MMHMQTKLNRTKTLSLALAVTLLLGLFVPTALGQSGDNSQSGFNLSVTPVVANIQAKPGETSTTKIQVKNNNVNAERVKATLLKLQSNDKDGTPVLSEPEQNDDFPNWVHFSETSFVAEPNVWKTIDVTINPPATAAFGYYYAVTFTRDNVQTQAKVTNLTGAVAVPMLIDVSAPGEIRKADILDFKSNRNSYEFLPATFTVNLKNSGNTHVAPRGNVFITKGSKSIGMLEVNQAKGNILPGSQRQFSAEWNDGSPVYKLKEVDGKVVLKNGKQTHFLDWSNFNPSKIRFGKYHAKIALVYNDGTSDVATEAEVDFWVIPWRIIGILIVVFLFIAAGIWATLIRPVRKGVKKLPPMRLKKKQ
jgi:hypothetical protein